MPKNNSWSRKKLQPGSGNGKRSWDPSSRLLVHMEPKEDNRLHSVPGSGSPQVCGGSVSAELPRPLPLEGCGA